MSAPNIVNVATITAKTATALLTGTSAVNAVNNPASSGKVMKINSLIISNVDGTNAADVYVDYYDSSTTTAKALAHTISVPADSAFNPIGGKLVLEAGDQLRAWAGAASDLEIVVSVLEIT